MPTKPPAAETAEQREEREDQQREAYLLWVAALTEKVEDFEAGINGDFDDYMDRVDAAAERTRNRIESTLRDGLEYEDGALDPEASALLSTRAKVDRHLWDWRDSAITGLGVVTAGAGVRGADKAVEVFNRSYRVDRGGPADDIRAAYEQGVSATEEAAGALPKAARKAALTASEAAASVVSGVLSGIIASAIDNPIRAIEQRAHQSSMATVDATSGPMTESAIVGVGRKFTAPANILKASFLTHRRSAFRAVLGNFGLNMAAGSLASAAFLYYIPARDRRKAAPEGFGAKHHALIRTEREWRSIMRALDHKRPGSFLFSTGFHVMDPGYLLPIPAALLLAAREIERRKRQRFLESIRGDDDEE